MIERFVLVLEDDEGGLDHFGPFTSKRRAEFYSDQANALGRYAQVGELQPASYVPETLKIIAEDIHA